MNNFSLSNNSNKIAKSMGISNELVIMFFFTIVILFLGLVLFLCIYLTSKKNKAAQYAEEELIDYFHDASTYLKVDSSKIPSSIVGSNFSLGMWILINRFPTDISYVFSRGNIDINNKLGSPSIMIYQNRLLIRMATSDSNNMAPATSSCSDENDTCLILDDLPLGRFFHIFTNINRNVIELYFNGKLINSTIITKELKNDTSYPLHISPFRGFDGFITKLTYFSGFLPPKDIFNRYLKGPRNNII